MIIYDKNDEVRIDVHESADSQVVETIADGEYVSFKFKYASEIAFEVGDNLTVFGNKYTLRKKPTPLVKNGSNSYDYTLKFHSPRELCKDVNFTLFDDSSAPAQYDFPVVLSPRRYAQLIVDNMNKCVATSY